MSKAKKASQKLRGRGLTRSTPYRGISAATKGKHMSQKARESEASKRQYELQQQIERLKAENAELTAQGAVRQVTLAVSAKGGLSVYGLGRFPVTLYAEQWSAILNRVDEIQKFMQAHSAQLKRRNGQ